jgi:hydroxypyruvate reductase
MTTHVRQLLEALHAAAVTGADSTRAVTRTLAADARLGERDTWIIAIGKAGHPMASAAVAALASRDKAPRGGVIVSTELAHVPHPSLEVVAGDHPVPGHRSLEAASALGDVVARVRQSDEVLVLLSGGTTSLLGAPIEGVELSDLIRLYDGLLASGLDIVDKNANRIRVVRWGAG